MNEATGIVENFVINMQEPIYGANNLFAVLQYNRGTIQSVLEDRIAEEILDGNIRKNKLSKIGVQDGKIVIL